MSAVVARDDLSLRRPIVVSAAVHALVVALFVLVRPNAMPPVPPTYRVSLIAAPAGPRAIGVVQPAVAAAAPASSSAPAPARVSRTAPDPARMKAPAKGRSAPAPKLSTPAVAPAAPPSRTAGSPGRPAAPTAGGGPVGGRGADVANVQVDGIAFPYPGYLENVVRQIALRFKPPRAGALQAVVAFLIRRDGSVAGIRLTTRSGVYSFDTEAMGAVDAAAQSRAFGPLPRDFSDDALPVIFSFDPRLIR